MRHLSENILEDEGKNTFEFTRVFINTLTWNMEQLFSYVRMI